jgi:hypothetical protein
MSNVQTRVVFLLLAAAALQIGFNPSGWQASVKNLLAGDGLKITVMWGIAAVLLIWLSDASGGIATGLAAIILILAIMHHQKQITAFVSGVNQTASTVGSHL